MVDLDDIVCDRKVVFLSGELYRVGAVSEHILIQRAWRLLMSCLRREVILKRQRLFQRLTRMSSCGLAHHFTLVLKGGLIQFIRVDNTAGCVMR